MRDGQDVSLGIQNGFLSTLIAHWGLERPEILAHDFGGATALRARKPMNWGSENRPKCALFAPIGELSAPIRYTPANHEEARNPARGAQRH